MFAKEIKMIPQKKKFKSKVKEMVLGQEMHTFTHNHQLFTIYMSIMFESHRRD